MTTPSGDAPVDETDPVVRTLSSAFSTQMLQVFLGEAVPRLKIECATEEFLGFDVTSFDLGDAT